MTMRRPRDRVPRRGVILTCHRDRRPGIRQVSLRLPAGSRLDHRSRARSFQASCSGPVGPPIHLGFGQRAGLRPANHSGCLVVPRSSCWTQATSFGIWPVMTSRQDAISSCVPVPRSSFSACRHGRQRLAHKSTARGRCLFGTEENAKARGSCRSVCEHCRPARGPFAGWNNRRHEPLRLAHLDHGDQRVILLKGGEGPARVKGLRHGACYGLSSEDMAPSALLNGYRWSARERLCYRPATPPPGT
jgi:hypothetical protein